MTQKVPLLVVPLNLSKKLNKPLIGLSAKLTNVVPGIKYDLEKTDIDMDAKEYISHSLVTSLFMLFLLWVVVTPLFFRVRELPLNQSIILGFAIGLAFFLLFFFILMRYPKIVAGKKAEQVDKNLIFALKDLLMQINSGVTLYNSVVNVAKSNYGIVSQEFEKVAKNVKTGMSMSRALEKMAVETDSDYLRRTLWQLLNTIKAGASLKGALKTLIDELAVAQHNKINDYARELNLWTLIYMLFAVAIPTIGSTMLVILSSFAGFGVTQGTFIVFITITFFVQIALIGFVKNRRPVVNF
jgi:archaeal flagellar protein FlaJ